MQIFFVLITLFTCNTFSFRCPIPTAIKYTSSRIKIQADFGGEKTNVNSNQGLQEITIDDMKKMATILSNITEYLYEKPNVAIKIASDNIGWLYSRNVPALTQMLLNEYPQLREDKMMLEAFMFLIDFLEAVTKETTELIQQNQKLMKLVLEASKVSEANFDGVIQKYSKNLTSPEFMLYLDTEIENLEVNSQIQNVLVTIKLRLLDEVGKSKGVDVMLLPKLAAEDDPLVMRTKTIDHLRGYPLEGCELFLMTLKLMRSEMRKRYNQVDPTLLNNLSEIEKITKSYIDSEKKIAAKR